MRHVIAIGTTFDHPEEREKLISSIVIVTNTFVVNEQSSDDG